MIPHKKEEKIIKRSIQEMQGYLRKIASAYRRIPEVRADGIFGSQTTEAVTAFQKEFHLPPNGVVDFHTWREIYRVYLIVNARNQPPHHRPRFPLERGSFSIGDQGSEVVVIQTILNRLGERYRTFLPVRCVGIYEEQTAENIRRLQHRSGLPQTGFVDADTWNVLLAVNDADLSKP